MFQHFNVFVRCAQIIWNDIQVPFFFSVSAISNMVKCGQCEILSASKRSIFEMKSFCVFFLSCYFHSFKTFLIHTRKHAYTRSQYIAIGLHTESDILKKLETCNKGFEKLTHRNVEIARQRQKYLIKFDRIQ